MPKYIRIDERLIHGQILQKWLEFTGCETIYVSDDETAGDPILQSVLLMTVPAAKVEFLDEQTGAERLKKTEKEPLILLKSLETLWRLYRQGVWMDRVNVCRLPYGAGKKAIYQNLYISGEEEHILKRMIQDGVDVYVQTVPDNDEVHMRDLLN